MKKEPRNPFTISLLRRMIKAEAAMVFGKGDDNIVKYLSIPRTDDQNTIEDVKSSKRKASDSSKELAAGALRWVIKNGGNFSFTDDKIEFVTQRLTFFCRPESFKEFTEMYSNFSHGFDDYIGCKLTPTQKYRFDRQVEEVFLEEETYLEQRGILHGNERKDIIRLAGRHAIRTARNTEVLYKAVKDLQKYADSREGEFESIKYVVVDPKCNISGVISIILSVAKYVKGSGLFNYALEPKVINDMIPVKYIRAKNDLIFFTVLRHLQYMLIITKSCERMNTLDIHLTKSAEQIKSDLLSLGFTQRENINGDDFALQTNLMNFNRLINSTTLGILLY